MAYDEKWEAYTTHPEWGTLTPAEQQKVARKFAQKVVRKEVPSSNDARMQGFLNKNLNPIKGETRKPGAMNALTDLKNSAKEGAKSSAVGMIYRGKLPDEGIGIVDAAKELWSGGNSLLGPGALHGYAGVAGQVLPDMALGGVAGGLAKTALMKAGVKALPAQVASSVGTGAAISGGAVKVAGGTNEQVLGATVAGGAGGLLPFARTAARAVPAGKWYSNPIGGKKAAPPPPPGGQQQQPPPPPPGDDGQAPPGGWRSQPPPPGGGQQKPPPPPPGGGPKQKPPPGPDAEAQAKQERYRQQQEAQREADARQRAAEERIRQERYRQQQERARQQQEQARQQQQNTPPPPPPGGGPKAGPQQPPPGGPYQQRIPFDDEATGVHGRYTEAVQQAKDYITQATRELENAKVMRDAATGKRRALLDKAVADREADLMNAPRRVKKAQDAADEYIKKWDQWNQGGQRGGRPGFIDFGKLAKATARGAQKIAGLGVEGVSRSWKAGGAGINLAARGVNALTPDVVPSTIERNALIPGGQMLHQLSEDIGINDFTRGVGQKIDTAMVKPLSPDTISPYVGDAAAGPLSTGVNALRRGMVSGYGVDPQVHDQFTRISNANAEAIYAPTRKLFNELAQLPTGQQFDIHYQASEPTYTGPLSPEAKRLQDDNQRVNDEMLRLGVISQQEHDRWGKYYVGPREFAKHEATSPKDYRSGRRNRAKVKVDAGRGTTVTMSENEMLAQNASGARWEQIGATDANGNVTAWRDWTPQERASWGEHRNLGRTGAKKIASGVANASSADFLAWVARRPEYARDPSSFPLGIGDQRPDVLTDPDGTVWHLMPDTAAGPGRGRVRKYGNLAGQYVREDLKNYVYDQTQLEAIIPTLEKISGANWWKKAMTIYNVPGYFLNNIGHNIPMLLTNGGAVSDLPGALVALSSDSDQVVRNLTRQGYIKNDAMKREMSAHLATAMRNRYDENVAPGPMSFTRAMMDVVETYHATEGGLYNLAQTTDDAFRVALVKRLMADGVPYEEAAARMNRVFYNPGNVTAPIPRLLSATAVPFAKVNWYLTDAITQTATNNPVRSAELLGMYHLMPLLLGLAAGLTVDEVRRQRKALPPHMQPVGNALPLGTQGGMTQQDHWLGTGAFNPTQNWMANPQAAVPGLPRGFQPSGPWPTLYNAFASNYDPNLGKKITERDSQENIIGGSLLKGTPLEGTTPDVSNSALEYMGRNLLPGVVNKAMRFNDASQGKVDKRGNIVESVTAAERMMGLQVQPVDTKNASQMAMIVGHGDGKKYRAKAFQLVIAAKKAEKNGDHESAEKWRAEAMELLKQAQQAEKAGAGRSKELRGTMDGYPVPTNALTR